MRVAHFHFLRFQDLITLLVLCLQLVLSELMLWFLSLHWSAETLPKFSLLKHLAAVLLLLDRPKLKSLAIGFIFASTLCLVLSIFFICIFLIRRYVLCYVGLVLFRMILFIGDVRHVLVVGLFVDDTTNWILFSVYSSQGWSFTDTRWFWRLVSMLIIELALGFLHVQILYLISIIQRLSSH